MALDCGFDIFPHLPATEENKRIFREFFVEVAETFRLKMITEPAPSNGPREERFYKYFRMTIPGHPIIPDAENCDCFLSVRSNDALDPNALPVIKEMAAIARYYFGSRVHFWQGHSDIYSSGELRRAEDEAKKRAEMCTQDHSGTSADNAEQTHT
ncbi:SET domain-containing protein [Fusarium heterosporum]|uniref:SET domain-containing protein n=1 Tax=Fusarium heterosporum TaxID=42747 RepID=A0A8H5TVX2_FUSHE|nr:SET domain-containing protein [Fusarium heterosporum]